ncbi:hypothetical protein [Ginsengibacter hankyongi]|nr:hypothetical protein [Ginsengibacter hankyongi]
MYVGDEDNFYLNLAVHDFQDFLKHTENPHYEGTLNTALDEGPRLAARTH